MSWLSSRNVVVSYSKWLSLALLFRSPVRRYCIPLTKKSDRIYCFKDGRSLKGAAKKLEEEAAETDNDKLLSHLVWWKERLDRCRKPSAVNLIQRLVFSNLLGLDVNLKNGKLKDGTLNSEIIQFKSKFPREVLLCRVGEFYEAIGIDACILVEYAGLNPFGGLRSATIPKAGCPVMNLRQTLDDLTRNGFSVCIVEEIQGPTQARTRKGRFISGHARPGSPYVYGLVEIEHDIDFPEPMPVIGISRSASGYCMTVVLETMKTYSLEDGLTEEALVTKLHTCRCHNLFLHTSLKHNASGTCRWGEFGEGGLLWGECNTRQFEWFEGNPVTQLLTKVKELYGLDDKVSFRTINVRSESRPCPLHLGTATQVGVIPTEGIPCLLKVLLPANCTGLPFLYMRDLLLNPPPYEIASRIQATGKLMGEVTCSIPEFTCISSAKVVKLLEQREANHMEFCRIKIVLDEVLHMHGHPDLNEILTLLMEPTWVATGLKIDLQTLVKECEWASRTIGELISPEDDSDQKISKSDSVPNDFFEDMESSWKCRVKRMHIEEEFTEVGRAAQALSMAVTEDFLPIVSRIKATTAAFGVPKGEVLYAREHEAVWFKGKRFVPSVWAGTPGEEQIQQLKPAMDSKGRRVGEEWFSTDRVEDALVRYHGAGEKAKLRVMQLLRGLSVDLQTKINILVFASMLLVIAKALFCHVSEGRRRKWVFPALGDLNMLKGSTGMRIVGLSPYWFDAAEGSAVNNTIDMQSLQLLTGPNGGGKSSLLRSICAAALLGMCGFMVPGESAFIPHFDSIMLHMKSYDSPADGKSSFQVEMSEIRSIVTQATSRSLVLVDEICRGTETAKGTCIAGSVVETLDRIGCLGIVSTHLHGIFDLPLRSKSVVYKAMGAEYVDGETKPTWKLRDGICRESLAFETAKKEGIPKIILERAEDLYLTLSGRIYHADAGEKTCVPAAVRSIQELENSIVMICQKKMMEICRLLEPVALQCVKISAREQPPPSTIGTSCVYVMLRPDQKLYVGQTDNLEGRVRSHRSKQGMQNSSFLYLIVPAGKSGACQLETLLINQLHNEGYAMANLADGKHRNFGTSSVDIR